MGGVCKSGSGTGKIMRIRYPSRQVVKEHRTYHRKQVLNPPSQVSRGGYGGIEAAKK